MSLYHFTIENKSQQEIIVTMDGFAHVQPPHINAVYEHKNPFRYLDIQIQATDDIDSLVFSHELSQNLNQGLFEVMPGKVNVL